MPSSEDSDSGDGNENSDNPQPITESLVVIPTTDKQVFRQMEDDFSRFDALMETNLATTNALCFENLIPLKNYDEMVAQRRRIAKKSQAVRSAVADVQYSLDELKQELMCCPFRLPESVITQDRPDKLVSMSTQQIENLLKRKRRNEFAGKVETKRRAFSEYALQGGKILPKSDEAIQSFIDILSRCSLVAELAEKIEFPDRKALQDVNSFKSWFKGVSLVSEDRARAYVRLCNVVKEREKAAKGHCDRRLISEKKLNQILNVAQSENVKSLLSHDFVRLLDWSPLAEKKSKKDKK